MTLYRITTTPRLGWCAACYASWTPDMIPVRLYPGGPEVCGSCILAMAQAVEAEQVRRDGERIAQRGCV
jgi:hypothetical protein